MLRSVRKMKHLALGALDGRIGHVEEFYFDDSHWTIRYLVAQAGNWLTGRLVLLSPHVLGLPDVGQKVLPVNLTRDQIRHSPAPETDRPVSRQFEEDYYKYFGWPYYWAGPYLWGPSPFPVLPSSPLEAPTPSDERLRADFPKGNPHLRSSDEMAGYHMRAQDGEIGHLEDFLYDDKDWSIRYVVVGTRNWWPGKQVLVPPTWIGQIHWEDREVKAEVVREDIRQAPAFDPAEPMTEAFEDQLARYYETDLHKV
ncbi:MAG: PRC-barrel domain protein [Fibrobacteres bacterium]|nr:PRC-barrel domain protein [Fibrobacterota bacterium]